MFEPMLTNLASKRCTCRVGDVADGIGLLAGRFRSIKDCDAPFPPKLSMVSMAMPSDCTRG
jgi:hypothetical protein